MNKIIKKETIIWQIIIVVLGFIIIFLLKDFFEKKVVLEAMSIQANTMSSRANCFLIAQEKNLNDAHCDSVDTDAFKLIGKYKTKFTPVY